jgi:hypothetical protein
MAVVIIGGVLSSTLLSLVLVPVMYTLLEDGKHAVSRGLGWRPLRRRPTAPAPARAGVHAGAHPSLAETRPIQGGSIDE